MTYAEQQAAKKKDLSSGIIMTIITVSLIGGLITMIAKHLG
jgi:hypothetical protein